MSHTYSITQYLRYLRDVSRKIIVRNGFEKCLLNKQNKFALQINHFKKRVSAFDGEYDTYSWYYDQVKSSPEKKLFIGFGLICGTKKNKIIAGPLVYIQCDIDKEDDGTYSIDFFDEANLNYDLIASLSDTVNDEDNDVFTPSSTNQTLLLERLENDILKCNSFNSLQNFTTDAFLRLRIDFSEFAGIAIRNEVLSYRDEINKYLTAKATSLFKGSLKCFCEEAFSFIAAMPDQLSTYQALHSFVQSIEQTSNFNNPVVEKLLANALTGNKIHVKQSLQRDLEWVIENEIPLSLSQSQKQAILNAWQNEISYIQGPPGTGKSHTISGLLLSALSLNKRVLVVSQKQPALEVVNQKINPLLSDDDELLGVVYFDKDSKKSIKDYVNKILGNRFFHRWEYLDQNIKIKLEELAERKSQLNRYQNLLIANLKQQHEFKERNEMLTDAINKFSKNFASLPENFSFKVIKNKLAYNTAKAAISNIYIAPSKSYAAKLYEHKYKKHLVEKLNFPKEWTNKSSFHMWSENFVNLNETYTLVNDSRSKIVSDETNLRLLIRDLEKDVERLKKTLIKLKYKSNLFNQLKIRSVVEDLEQFGKMLHWTNGKIVQKRMADINFENIVSIFPFWTAEIRNIGQLFPLQENLFDLIIVDEASQVNLAEIIPVFYRGKNICIVGDHNQLNLKATGLSFGLTESFDEKIWNKYNGSQISYKTAEEKCLIVKKASILDFIKSPNYSVQIKEVMLEEHFRSLPQLARYTSKTFYKDENNPSNIMGKLKIMTETPDKLSLQCFKAYFVDGSRDNERKNKIVWNEVNACIKLISFLTSYPDDNASLLDNKFIFPSHVDSSNFSIGVISIIRDQCEAIKEKISEHFSEEIRSKFKILVGTPEEFQGSERDVMIFSLCLDENCKGGHGHFQDKQRLNVATSRAKFFTYFIYSKFPVSFDKIYSYLKSMAVDIEYLPDNIVEKEITSLPSFDSNKLESDFERRVFESLDGYIRKRRKSGHTLSIHNQIVSCGQKRLDFVIYNESTKRSTAIEVDGSFHFNPGGLKQNYTNEHLERMEILQRAGWKIINTPYYKWYKNGWLSETTEPILMEEIERIYRELDKNLVHNL